jgi:5-methylcytosine-specific restriction endonuclease McrA
VPIIRLCPNCGTPLAEGVLRGRCPRCKREQDQAKNKRRTAARRARLTSRWQTVRAQAIRRDGNRCTNCGSTEKLEGHHIRPLAKGGSAYSLDNIITLCASCHQQEFRFF